MRKGGITILIVVIVLLIIYIVNPFDVDIPIIGGYKNSDILDVITINDKSLNITYKKGNLIDEKMYFNNSLEKIIEVKNTSDELLSYSIKLTESSITSNKLIYSLSVSSEIDGAYTPIIEEKNIIGDYCMKYNIGIEPNKTEYLKIVFKSLNETDEVSFKGKIEVAPDLTKKDVFANSVVDTYNAILKHIEEINGIRWAGFYYLDVRELNVPDSNLSGQVIINATDISDIIYNFILYDETYMLYRYAYNNKFNKTYIKDRDNGILGSVDPNTSCSLYTSKGCGRFLDLTYTEGGSKKNFKDSVDKVVELVKKDFNKKNKNVVVYNVSTDIENPTNVRGYIVINNKVEEPEYFLYLTNDIFMIAGYNLTKLGDFSETSPAIRAYLVSTWKVNAASNGHVCGFSGFSNCQDKFGNNI